MRIGIDASRALASQRTGTENYSLHLIRHLLAQAEEELSEDTFDLYCPQRPPAGLFSDSPLARERVIPLPRLWTHVRLSLEMLTNRPDVLFVPAHIIPLFHPASCVVTIHDLGHLYYPETYPKNTLRYLTWGTQHNLKVAQHVLADSQVTKQDIEERFHVEPERITVVYPGISGEYRTGHTPNAIAGVRERYGIDGPYVLYVGTLHPRKNVERLLEAFVAAKQEHGLAETLVIAGRLGWLPEGILRRLKDAEPSVKLAGYVPENDLPLLYEGARLFVLPSLFEGFGMPILEAMACGTPVLAADSSSLPEVVADAGALFNPNDVDQLASSIAWLLQHPATLEDFRARGLERAREFSWDVAARRTLDILQAAGS